MTDPMGEEAPEYFDLSVNPEERLQLIEENVRDFAIFVVDVTGRIASWNRGAERILGYGDSEAIGMHCAEIFTPEDRAEGAVEYECGRAAEIGRAADERWHVRKDGTRFWGNGFMTGLRDERGNLRGYVKILRDETERKEAEEAREHEQNQRKNQERQAAILQERTRLAQDIHDTMAQAFTGISIQLEAAKEMLEAGGCDARTHIDRAQELARLGLAEARRSVWALRPQILEQDGLVVGLSRTAAETTSNTAITCRFLVKGAPVVLIPSVEDHLFRIAQEGVANVLRHARANSLTITLEFVPGQIQLQLTDDGQGFDTQAIPQGYGLIGMRERTSSIGGICDISSEMDKGTTIRVTVPIHAQ